VLVLWGKIAKFAAETINYHNNDFSMKRNLLLSAVLATALGAAALPFEVTTINSDGTFADGTKWYTLRLAAAGYYIHDVGSDATYLPLNQVTTEFADADLWCFTGNDTDGYQIYNKAVGSEKMLAGPTSVTSDGNTGGSSYAILKAAGDASYVYQWQFTTSSSLTDESYYLNLKGISSARMNNRSNKVSFWTSGADAGSSVRIAEGPRTISAATATGASPWVLSLDPEITLSCDGGTIANGCELSAGTWAFNTPSGYCIKSATYTDANGQTVTITGSGEDNTGMTITGPATVKDLKVVYQPTVWVNHGTIVFRYDGTTGYTVCYRIPAIATVAAGPNAGRVIALNDYRYSGADIGNGRIDLYQSVSNDNGLTWSTPDHMRDSAGEPVAQGTGNGTLATSLQNPDCGFGDAAIVSDRESGKLLVMSVCGRTPFWSGRRDNPNQVARWYSEDGGDTWTHFDNITEDIYSLFDGTCPNGYIDSMFFGSGRICQSSKIKVGDYYRLYAVLSGYNNAADVVSNWCLYSDDFGKTWAILGDPMTPPVAASGDEPKAEELPDGSVLISARCSGGNRNFDIFRYTDAKANKGDWMGSVNTNMGAGTTINACNGEILIVPAKNVATGKQCYMALQSFPRSTSRIDVTIAWKALESSTDFNSPQCFTAFDGFYLVTPLASAYSTMCWQQNNTLGFLYEEETCGLDYCGVYRNFTLEELTDGQYEYCADTDGAVAKEFTLEIMNTRLEAEAPTGIEPGKYLGQPTGDGCPDAEAALAAYKASGSVDDYIAFNAALANNTSVIAPKDNAIYRIISANNYATYEGKTLYLSASAQSSYLILPQVYNERCEWQLIPVAGEANAWTFFNAASGKYFAVLPSATNTRCSTTETASEAGKFTIESAADGRSAIVSLDGANASYPAIHLDSAGKVVIWTASADNSKWYIELMDDNTSIDEISADDAHAATVTYFDLTGRQVKQPIRGNLYITNDRRKIRF
jgi:hypothetical protein